MAHRPVCVKCEVEMRPEMNQVGVLDMSPFGPYKVWDADLWKCPECGYEIVTGFGLNAISHHYDECFDRVVDGYKNSSRLIVNKTQVN